MSRSVRPALNVKVGCKPYKLAFVALVDAADVEDNIVPKSDLSICADRSELSVLMFERAIYYLENMKQVRRLENGDIEVFP